jgi:thiamine monophosphate synthase
MAGRFPFRRLAHYLGAAAQYAAAGRPLPASRWLAASCHNAEELALAEEMGVDFVTLSPVQPTLTIRAPNRWVGNRPRP